MDQRQRRLDLVGPRRTSQDAQVNRSSTWRSSETSQPARTLAAVRFAASRTSGLFIMNSACGATFVVLRRPFTDRASPKSNSWKSEGRSLRTTGK